MKKTKQKIFSIINLVFDENDKKNHMFIIIDNRN